MFKSARWRSDKNKIKAVFKLQFHATQVSQSVGDALMISIVPADVGKPTIRLERVIIHDGSCYWENPVYETLKFVQEPKTGKIHEIIYHFVLTMGSSKAGSVGQASIDFANYAEATKVSCLSIPIKNAKYDAVLHVSIQRMLDSVNKREFEEAEYDKLSSHDRSLGAKFTNGDADESIKSNSAEDGPFNNTISHIAELNWNRKTSCGSDVTMSISESSSGLDMPIKLSVKKNDLHHNPIGFLSSLSHDSVPQKSTIDTSIVAYDEHQRSQWEWLGGSAPEVSTDDSSTSPREMSHEASDIVVEKLKAELAVLSRQAEVSEMELQTLRKQIVKESKRGQDLSREIIDLKEERDVLKKESKKFNAFRENTFVAKNKNKLLFEDGDPRTILEELRQELSYEKDLNRNLHLQLQKTQESNSELILAVRDLDEMLEMKNGEISNIFDITVISENSKELQETDSQWETNDDEEQKALEELVKEHSDANEAYLLEQKVMDLYSEMETYKRERDELEMKTEQLALDYEILKQENHDISYKLEQSQLEEQLKMQYECSSSYGSINELESQIESLENELKNKSKEFSDSFVTINELESRVKMLEEELEKQAQGFEAELEALVCAKVEQEQRAVRAEETLRKTRWQNANTAERLQEEFKKLSVEMASTFEINEKLAVNAMTEASELRLQKIHLEEMLEKTMEELQSVRDSYEAKLDDLFSQITSKRNQIEQMQQIIDEKSTQVEHQKNHYEETHWLVSQDVKMLSAEIERLTTENNNLLSARAEEKEPLRAELEQVKTSIKEAKMLLKRGNTEKNELENTIAMMKKEMEKSLKELNVMRRLKEEKESVIGNLQSEMESIKVQCNELRHSLSEDELERGKLRKQVFKLKSDLKKKEDAFKGIEKKLKDDNNGRATVFEATKSTSRNNVHLPSPRGSKEVVNLKEKIKFLEDMTKEKETALETSTNTFLEKERDLHNKIGDLERRLEAFNHNSTNICEYKFKKVTEDAENLTLNGNTAENLSTMPSMSNQTEKSTDDNLSDKEQLGSPIGTGDKGGLDELLNEMEILKERNESMECELKEMQERYSEISLKFAEVEGERQQLVMTVRNLRNPKIKPVNSP